MKQPIGERLMGAWELVSYIEHPVDGGPLTYPFGEKPKGIILYTAEGYMSVQIMKPDRRDFASGDWSNGSAEEYIAAGKSYIAYSGTYEVNEEDNTVSHVIFVSLFPNWLKKVPVRTVAFDRDYLHLGIATPMEAGGKFVTANLVWQRAKAAGASWSSTQCA